MALTCDDCNSKRLLPFFFFSETFYLAFSSLSVLSRTIANVWERQRESEKKE